MTSTTARPGATSPPARPVRTALSASAVALGAGVAGNVIVWGLARWLGVEFVMSGAGTETFSLPASVVIIITALSMMVGAVLLVMTAGRPWAWPLLAWLGLAVGIVTAPLPFVIPASTGTAVALCLMHLVAGGAWFATLRHLRPRRRNSTASSTTAG